MCHSIIVYGEVASHCPSYVALIILTDEAKMIVQQSHARSMEFDFDVCAACLKDLLRHAVIEDRYMIMGQCGQRMCMCVCVILCAIYVNECVYACVQSIY